MTQNTILIAEDEEVDVYLVKALLGQCGVLNPLRVVMDGAQAICYLRGESIYADRFLYPLPVLFLLDLRMPRIGGLEVLRWLRLQPKITFPIIVMTAFNDLGVLNEAYQLGAHSFLSKPLRKEDFLLLVRGFKGIELGETGGRLTLPDPPSGLLGLAG